MLKGFVKPISAYSEQEIETMYQLMAQFYDHTDPEVFRRDFADKDYCLALYHETDGLVGFTTQKVLTLSVDGKPVHGMFSGDTIIHKDHWGDVELFRVWAQFWFAFAEQYEAFYWFLICKGYKTYRILPLFWTEFFPNYRMETTPYAKRIMDAYASLLYPDAYDPESGVIVYKTQKDKLKEGVAEIGVRQLKNKDVAFFCERNPGHLIGNDLVCLAKIDKALLRKHAHELLFR